MSFATLQAKQTAHISFEDVLDDAQTVYVYDGTLEGLFTSIFEAFARRDNPANIVEDRHIQHSLLCSYTPIHTQLDLAQRVHDSIINKLGDDTYHRVKQVFLSADANKGEIILSFLRYALMRGPKACFHYANPAVAAFEDTRKQVGNEAHHLLQFVRFAQLENGVYYSRIDPHASVVPLMMDHFAARFNVQPFIIYDATHSLAGIFDTERWWLTSADEITLPNKTQAEDQFQSLWQTFYDTIAIEERKNYKCQRNFMPKRFWGNMCEHIPPSLRNIKPSCETPTNVAKRSAKALPAKCARTAKHEVPRLQA